MKIKLARYNVQTLEAVGVVILHLCEIAARFPCNHANALYFEYGDCILALALFEVIYSFVKRQICFSFWMIFVMSFVFPVVEDRFNILVPYDKWIARGMPDWGEE